MKKEKKKQIQIFTKLFTLIVTIIMLSIFAGCPASATPDPETDGLVIQGTLPSEATIESVLLFYDNSVVKETIIDNSFSIKADYHKPAGLVFLDGNDGYKGHVQFGTNMNALPLQATEDENQIFDLGQLSIADNAVYIPQNDPMEKITTTAKELDSITTFGSLFSSIVANPDFDNNGVVDVVEDKSIHATILYFFDNSPSFNSNLTPEISPESTTIGAHKFHVSLDYPVLFGTGDVSLLYPGGPTLFAEVGNENSFFFDGQEGLPKQGEYVFSIDNGTTQFDYTLDLQSTAQQINDNIAIIVPTVALNDDDTFHSITWEAYQADQADMSITIMDQPEVIMDKLEIQIDVDYEVEDYDINNPNRIYNSGWLDVNSGVHILSKQDIDVNNLERLCFAYDDHYGNHYVISYNP